MFLGEFEGAFFKKTPQALIRFIAGINRKLSKIRRASIGSFCKNRPFNLKHRTTLPVELLAETAQRLFAAQARRRHFRKRQSERENRHLQGAKLNKKFLGEFEGSFFKKTPQALIRFIAGINRKLSKIRRASIGSFCKNRPFDCKHRTTLPVELLAETAQRLFAAQARRRHFRKRQSERENRHLQGAKLNKKFLGEFEGSFFKKSPQALIRFIAGINRKLSKIRRASIGSFCKNRPFDCKHRTTLPVELLAETAQRLFAAQARRRHFRKRQSERENRHLQGAKLNKKFLGEFEGSFFKKTPQAYIRFIAGINRKLSKIRRASIGNFCKNRPFNLKHRTTLPVELLAETAQRLFAAQARRRHFRKRQSERENRHLQGAKLNKKFLGEFEGSLFIPKILSRKPLIRSQV